MRSRPQMRRFVGQYRIDAPYQIPSREMLCLRQQADRINRATRGNPSAFGCDKIISRPIVSATEWPYRVRRVAQKNRRCKLQG